MLKTYTTHLLEKKHLVGDIFLFNFILDNSNEISFLPGQYLILLVPQKNNQEVKRLYSIASSPINKNNFELIIKCVPGGIGSEYLKKIKPGDKVDFQGPAGMFTLKENRNNKIFLATGTGIAPIRSMIYQIKSKKLQVKSYLFWGLRHYKDIYLFDEFKDLAEKEPNFQFWICLSREKRMKNIPKEIREHFILGRANIGFDNFLKKKTKEGLKLNKTDFYICGSRLVVGFLKNHLYSQGIAKENLFFEKF